MGIKELINLAVQKDSRFGEQIRYWVLERKKNPDLDWLMHNLERILGREYVKEAAESEINKTITE